jgi:hypothetical protein
MEETINQGGRYISDALAGLDMDYTQQQSVLDTLSNRILDFQSPDLTGIESSIGDVLLQMEQGPDVDEAFGVVARSMGFNTADEYFAWLGEQRGLTRADMQGLTPEERTEYERLARVSMAQQERAAQNQLEAVFANTGSAIQYMAAADEANAQLVNTRNQYAFQQMNQDIALKSQELDRAMNQYNQAVETGAMTALEYMQIRETGYYNLLDGYFGNANLLMQEAEMDLAALNSQFTAVYNSMMIQTGINQGILDTVNTAYETSMAPMMDSLNAMLVKENLGAQDVETVFGFLGLIIDAIGLFVPGGG